MSLASYLTALPRNLHTGQHEAPSKAATLHRWCGHDHSDAVASDVMPATYLPHNAHAHIMHAFPCRILAPLEGFEPSTTRLTDGRSTAELQGNSDLVPEGGLEPPTLRL